jgi:hypothetical protein
VVSFYRIEFFRGPYDGLVVEENAMIAPRLRLPVGPSDHFPPPSAPAPVYQLSTKILRWDEGSPQAVLRYEFQGNMTQVGAGGQPSLARRALGWLRRPGRRLRGWMMAPIDYPMSTRQDK